MIEDLVRAVRAQNVILFVGAGVSMPLGLPSFGMLIKHLAEELNYDFDIYSTQGSWSELAEYYALEKGTIEPLREWMNGTWHANRNVGESEIHRLIVDLKFPIIYTTNFDSWLERAHKLHGRDYLKIANAGDLPNIQPNLTQIVKFHGDLEDHSAIVLTESSYFERLAFETPLDIKLRSDSLGRSVLFIGYSLSDVNIRYMSYRLHRQWDSSGYASKRPKSYIFLSHPNIVQERIFRDRGIFPIVSEFDDPEQGLRDFLQRLADGVLND